MNFLLTTGIAANRTTGLPDGQVWHDSCRERERERERERHLRCILYKVHAHT